MLAKTADDLEAVHLGHHYVQYNHVVVALFGVKVAVLAFIDYIGNYFVAAKQFAQSVCKTNLIVYDKYFHRKCLLFLFVQATNVTLAVLHCLHVVRRISPRKSAYMTLYTVNIPV